jgi:hypothetical protein
LSKIESELKIKRIVNGMRHNFKYNGSLLQAFEDFLCERESIGTQTGENIEQDRMSTLKGKGMANRLMTFSLKKKAK